MLDVFVVFVVFTSFEAFNFPNSSSGIKLVGGLGWAEFMTVTSVYSSFIL